MLQFRVRGSAGDLYDVTAQRRGEAVIMTCTCEAARKGIHCHHRLELLSGEVSAITSDNADDLVTLAALVAGSALEAALADLRKAEEIQRAAKLERDRRMKAIDRLLALH